MFEEAFVKVVKDVVALFGLATCGLTLYHFVNVVAFEVSVETKLSSLLVLWNTDSCDNCSLLSFRTV